MATRRCGRTLPDRGLADHFVATVSTRASGCHALCLATPRRSNDDDGGGDDNDDDDEKKKAKAKKKKAKTKRRGEPPLTVFSWGRGRDGALGRGTLLDGFSPEPVAAAAREAVAVVSAGASTSLAVSRDGGHSTRGATTRAGSAVWATRKRATGSRRAQGSEAVMALQHFGPAAATVKKERADCPGKAMAKQREEEDKLKATAARNPEVRAAARSLSDRRGACGWSARASSTASPSASDSRPRLRAVALLPGAARAARQQGTEKPQLGSCAGGRGVREDDGVHVAPHEHDAPRRPPPEARGPRGERAVGR